MAVTQYTFLPGEYRAYVRTTYTNGKMETNTVNSNKFTFLTGSPVISDIELGEDWDGSEIAIMYSGNNNSLTVQVSNSQIIFTLYTGNTSIYSWTSSHGTDISDLDKIHVSFLKDDIHFFAKPSFIYETATGVYSYNQEVLTDAEMLSVYTWLLGDANPPSEYSSFVNGVNKLYIGTQNFIADQNGIYGIFDLSGTISFGTQDYSMIGNSIDRGFLGGTDSGQVRGSYRSTLENGTNDSIYVTTPITISVTTTNNSATVSYSDYEIIPLTSFLKANGSYIDSGNAFYMCWSSGKYCARRTEGTLNSFTQTSFNSLSDAISYIYKYFANINVIVDGVLWVKR